jgi:hypothetical protein
LQILAYITCTQLTILAYHLLMVRTLGLHILMVCTLGLPILMVRTLGLPILTYMLPTILIYHHLRIMDLILPTSH